MNQYDRMSIEWINQNIGMGVIFISLFIIAVILIKFYKTGKEEKRLKEENERQLALLKERQEVINGFIAEKGGFKTERAALWEKVTTAEDTQRKTEEQVSVLQEEVIAAHSKGGMAVWEQVMPLLIAQRKTGSLELLITELRAEMSSLREESISSRKRIAALEERVSSG